MEDSTVDESASAAAESPALTKPPEEAMAQDTEEDSPTEVSDSPGPSEDVSGKNGTAPGETAVPVDGKEDSDDNVLLSEICDNPVKKKRGRLTKPQHVGNRMPKVALVKKIAKAKKQPVGLKKPMSAFNLFFQDTQGAVKHQQPNAKLADIKRAVSELWKTTSPDMKKKYQEQHKELQATYVQQLKEVQGDLPESPEVNSVELTKEEKKTPPISIQLSTPVKASGEISDESPMSSDISDDESSTKAAAADKPTEARPLVQQKPGTLVTTIRLPQTARRGRPALGRARRYMSKQVESTPESNSKSTIEEVTEPEPAEWKPEKEEPVELETSGKSNLKQYPLRSKQRAQKVESMEEEQPSVERDSPDAQSDSVCASSTDSDNQVLEAARAIVKKKRATETEENIVKRETKKKEATIGKKEKQDKIEVKSKEQEAQHMHEAPPVKKLKEDKLNKSEQKFNSPPEKATLGKPKNKEAKTKDKEKDKPANGSGRKKGMSKPKQLCVREGCHNLAISSPAWSDEYCSDSCVVQHARDTFLTWLATRQRDAQSV